MAIKDFNVSSFWEQSEFADKNYTDSSPTQKMIAAVEAELGYKLPTSYIELCRLRNGGIPANSAHRMSERTSWAPNHIAITGIYSIGGKKSNSLCGAFGSKFWIAEWEYPDIGIYFADCPSAGHDMLCLDYRVCGPGGEPRVVHVDQERNYKITVVAPNFECFIRGLESSESFNGVDA